MYPHNSKICGNIIIYTEWLMEVETTGHHTHNWSKISGLNISCV